MPDTALDLDRWFGDDRVAGVERYIQPEVTRPGWLALCQRVHHLSFEQALRFYAEEVFRERPKQQFDSEMAILGLCDRYFLLLHLLHREDLLAHGAKGNKWLYERCREVEAAPDDHLDLWARDHYKSSVITFAGTIQEILRDPEITICILSDTNKIAKPFLRQIMQEFAGNEELKTLYSDVLYAAPENRRTGSPQWSTEKGIIVKRQGNPKEATVEAHGLIDGMPVGKHYDLRIYDDVVTVESVSTPEMVSKVTERWELSDNLGRRHSRRWHIGTRYSYADSYALMLDRGVLVPRLYPATDDGKLTGNPVFLTQEEWDQKKRDQPGTVAAQLLQNPLAGQEATFDLTWFNTYTVRPLTLNVYILCDPSKGETERSDYTAFAVIGMDAAGNLYLLDGYRHRMDLADRWRLLQFLWNKWNRAPGVQGVRVGYERYGLQTDIEFFEIEMRANRAPTIPIEEVKWPRQGPQNKADRIERIVPDARQERFFLPALVHLPGRGACLWRMGESYIEHRDQRGELGEHARARTRGETYRVVETLKRLDKDRNIYDLTTAFLEEARLHPFGSHDDLLDAVSRVYDLDPVPPIVISDTALIPRVWEDGT